MIKVPEFFPAHASRPFVRAHGSGTVFSAVFPRNMKCGLQLIHVSDGETLYIPFTEEYRVGRICSVMVTPFDAAQWLYRYRCGEQWIPDPHAFAICRTMVLEEGEKKEITACSCHPLRARDLLEDGPEKPLPPADWASQVVYGLHVRGFTAACTDLEEDLRGTFAGTAARIPYLKDLGVTAVEIMPVYTPIPDQGRKKNFRTMQEALGAYPVGPNGDPMRDLRPRPNYWGFGAGLYCALRTEYGTQEQFAGMIRAFHQAGIRVILQIYFEKGILVQEQIEILRFYIGRYGIDGFRLKGSGCLAGNLAMEPSLADTALFGYDFPFEDLEKETEATGHIYYTDLENVLSAKAVSSAEETKAEEAGAGSGPMPVRVKRPSGSRAAQTAPLHDFSGLITCSDDYQTLLRRFVKSDDYVMKDFLKLMLTSPADHGILRYVTSYEGFTLADLVSYNDRHNEANGEFGLDGKADNYSWNCGEEGDTEDEEILALRRKQVRNFLTLLLLSRGTPLIWQGDERENSQGGNNNAYCQDNETSWIDWTPSAQRRELTSFAARLIAFRKEHKIFTGTKPFQYIDYLGIGHPDVSLHGAEAWNPDLGPFSHSIGLAFCENYAESSSKEAFRKSPSFTYLAINMYWKELSLALPKLPPHYVWKVFMDTSLPGGFLDRPLTPRDQHMVETAPRSVRILRAVPDLDSIREEKAQERLDRLAPAGLLKKESRRSVAAGKGSGSGEGSVPGLSERRAKRCAGTSLAPRYRR